jgi:hypothetical protein
MKRREFIALLGGGGLLLAAKVKRARGQQPAMPVVGYLHPDTPEQMVHLLKAFHKGLGEAGYADATHQVRACRQRQDRQGARFDRSRQAARAGGRGDRMKRRTFMSLIGGSATAWPLAARAC